MRLVAAPTAALNPRRQSEFRRGWWYAPQHTVMSTPSASSMSSLSSPRTATTYSLSKEASLARLTT